MIHEKLQKIQTALKAPKNQRNNFGGYNYRSCEDILEALKPLLCEHKCSITIEDKVECIGDQNYVHTVVTLTDWEDSSQVVTGAYAREPETKKGMDVAQITGATSSYARKYALNGMFAIDDTKDADTTNNGKEESKPVRVSRRSRVNNDECPF